MEFRDPASVHAGPGVDIDGTAHDQGRIGRRAADIHSLRQETAQDGGVMLGADGDPETGPQTGQRPDHRRRLRQMAETVPGNVEKDMRHGYRSGNCRGGRASTLDRAPDWENKNPPLLISNWKYRNQLTSSFRCTEEIQGFRSDKIWKHSRFKMLQTCHVLRSFCQIPVTPYR